MYKDFRIGYIQQFCCLLKIYMFLKQVDDMSGKGKSFFEEEEFYFYGNWFKSNTNFVN